jgi:hypothetical protein
MIRNMFLGAVVSSASLLGSAFGQAIVSNPQPSLGNATPVSLVITSNQIGAVSPHLIGLKFGKSEFGKAHQFFTATDSRGVSNLKGLNPLPGQSCLISIGADTTTWVPSGAANTAGQMSRADVDALASFIKAANCKLDYSASFLANTASSAANEVSYVAGATGPDLLAVGFGNEPDGYSMTAAKFAAAWNTFAKEALSQNSNLQFKGPETGIATNLALWLGAWYSANSSLPLAYGTQHYYVDGPAGCSACSESLMLESRSSEAYWSTMIMQKDKFEAGLATQLPVLLTETNNFYSGGAPGVSNSYGSSLYAFDFALQAAEAGFTSADFTVVDDWSQGYSALNLVNGYSYGPRPLYYGMYMAALTGYGPMLSTIVEAVPALHAYTVNDTINGTLNTAIINTADVNYQMNASYPAGLTLQGCSAYVMSDSAGITDTVGTELNIQGGHFDSSSNIVIQAPYGIPTKGNNSEIAIPAYSGILVKCSY